MGYSIFSSKQTWSSPRSKELVRMEVETEQEANQTMMHLLKQGHKINGLLPTDTSGQKSRRQRGGR